MFGEKLIIGQTELSLDDKNRMILPKFTCAEKDDSLILFKNGEYFELYEEKIFNKEIMERINFLNKKLKNCIDKKEINKINLILQDIYSNILGRVVCDSQKRIILTNILKDKEKSNKVLCIGAYDHVLLKPIEKKK